ncbi:MAG TPA: L-threonylcarbamoyladenylate synthase [Bacteroidales bacterium]|nr:L-threonylcarbamoyladenylate synthase [Bacteroidales bacterium]HRX96530.1 L-threonylcarbamoyladenylate synthase [Bacteroidales bacterium]
MLIRIHPDNPADRQLNVVIECLNDGGVIIFPTDTIYAMGCDIFKSKAIDRVARIKGVKPEKANFSFLCHDLSHLSDFTKPLNNDIFKLMKRTLPGPFTYILEANNNVPKILHRKKRTVGIRVPDNKIITEIIRQLGNPVMSTSIRDEDEIIEYSTDPELIHEKFENLVDIVIDGGYGDNEPSTIIDCTGEEIELIRQGKGLL